MTRSTNRKTTPLFILVAVLALGALASPATGSRLAVSPTRVVISGGSIGALTLRNHSTTEILVQARVVHWTQKDGGDVYEDTSEILISPPIIKLSPESDQIVRVAFSGPRVVDSEKAFRLILSEVVPSREADPGVAIRFAIEFNLPVFVMPGSAVRPDLVWALAAAPDGGLLLRATNAGKAHAQVRSVDLSCGDDPEAALATIHRARYVLVGSSISWPLPLDPESSCSQLAQVGEEPRKVVYDTDSVSEATADAGFAGRITEILDVSSVRGSGSQVSPSELHIRANTDFGLSESRLRVTLAHLPIAGAAPGGLQ